MKKNLLILATITVALVLSFALTSNLQAASAPDTIEMKSPYPHKKTIAVFTHLKHVQDYKIACGECHHDDKGKPLTALKDGDPVQKCFECHSKPGEIKGKAAKDLSKKEKRAYHANALHENCVGCHKTFNKGKDPKPAPQSCKDCHPKK